MHLLSGIFCKSGFGEWLRWVHFWSRCQLGPLKWHPHTAGSFNHSQWLRSTGQSHSAFYDLTLEVTRRYLCYMLVGTWRDLIQRGRRPGQNHQKWRPPGTILQAGITLQSFLHVNINSLIILKMVRCIFDYFTIDGTELMDIHTWYLEERLKVELSSFQRVLETRTEL